MAEINTLMPTDEPTEIKSARVEIQHIVACKACARSGKLPLGDGVCPLCNGTGIAEIRNHGIVEYANVDPIKEIIFWTFGLKAVIRYELFQNRVGAYVHGFSRKLRDIRGYFTRQRWPSDSDQSDSG